MSIVKKDNGIYKEIKNIYRKDSGIFKEIKNVYRKDNGIYKECYKNSILLKSAIASSNIDTNFDASGSTTYINSGDSWQSNYITVVSDYILKENDLINFIVNFGNPNNMQEAIFEIGAANSISATSITTIKSVNRTSTMLNNEVAAIITSTCSGKYLAWQFRIWSWLIDTDTPKTVEIWINNSNSVYINDTACVISN